MWHDLFLTSDKTFESALVISQHIKTKHFVQTSVVHDFETINFSENINIDGEIEKFNFGNLFFWKLKGFFEKDTTASLMKKRQTREQLEDQGNGVEPHPLVSRRNVFKLFNLLTERVRFYERGNHEGIP